MAKASKKSPEEEYELYGKPQNQTPQGPPRRREERMTDLMPVRFPLYVLEQDKATAADRSVSSWIRRTAIRILRACDR